MLWLSGCSLRNLDELYEGGSAVSGGASASAGTRSTLATGSTTGAGAGTTAGAGGSGGGVAGGAGGNTAAPTTEIGGASGIPNTGLGGTNSTAGGTASHTGPIQCPATVASGGTLVTPPSNDFETDFENWAKLSGSSGLSRVQGDDTACSGTAYMTCGGFRQGGWDGPGISLLPYMIAGHSYVVSAAARFNSATLPSSGRSIGMTSVVVCENEDPVYTQLRRILTTSNWVRLQSDTPIKFPPVGCQTVVMWSVYIETDDADAGLGLDVDDFRLIDMTVPSGGAGGGGGAAGAAGAAGAGEAGVAGSG